MENELEKRYEMLVKEYSDMVTRLTLVHTGNFSDAEDCYQTVFFKLFKALQGNKAPPNPKAWLLKVTVNECRSLLRYRLGRSTVSLEEITVLSNDKRDHEMLDLIYRLSPKNRDAIYLYYYEGLSIQEIAAVTKTKENTVKSQLKRGREKLKELLEE